MLRKTLTLAAMAILTPLHAHGTGILVPAYFYPSFDPAQSFWDEMTAAARAGADITAIANVANGPGGAFNSDYAAAIDAFRHAGGKVLGYVYTCYGRDLCATGLPATRSAAQVLAEAESWASRYSIDGIFLDEMSNRASEWPFYSEIATGLRTAHTGWRIVGNPGIATPAEYLAVADTLVTFEGAGDYSGRLVEPWMETADPARQAHLHYNVETAGQMLALLAQARSRRAGLVYITDDRYTPGSSAEPNPWDRLPSYWQAELAAAAATVPEPAPLALLSLVLAAPLLHGLNGRRSRAQTSSGTSSIAPHGHSATQTPQPLQ